jgi:hypothetical protein
MDADALTADVVDEFIEARRAAGYAWQPTRVGLAPLVGYLRELAVVVEPPLPPVILTAVEDLLVRYRRYRVSERGLVEGTIAHYDGVARLFLSERPPDVPDRRGSRLGT